MTIEPAPASSDSDLGLTSVLPGSLPKSLGTPDAPQRYQIDAVFNRRPLPEELNALHADTATLPEAGYPDVTLTVSDRRLEIHQSNLEELESGLSTVLADVLARISRNVRDERESARRQSEHAADVEHTRADDVIRRAARIEFVSGI
ncbi:hypothetical protein [Microbacterium sp. RURRCA19A]|uniref:hypothetical protein n=1 Tax=Microbacterium sp. RURRCA19A TaxID=1907391 RepID=UPI000956EC36|nr:hypothetical protein [Microbacterium sp. RURRCA19A]SIS10936.1 hypothetical protein SAMN05880568_2830 [Microbacterium sp. RURRCA19A]